MNCTQCTKINNLPACLGAYASMTLTGLSFPDNPDADIVAHITNTATRQKWYIVFGEGNDPDISEIYDLMQHWYKIEFKVDGITARFIITNPDDTTVEGCCLEFFPDENLSQDSSEFAVSTTNCVVG